MKNVIFKSLEYIYYFLLFVLLILYLFPGNIIAFFMNGELTQPFSSSKSYFASLSHFFYFSCITFLAVIIKNKTNNILLNLNFIIFISIFLEITHIIIPNRYFEIYDLASNIIAVFTILLLKKLIRWKN